MRRRGGMRECFAVGKEERVANEGRAARDRAVGSRVVANGGLAEVR